MAYQAQNSANFLLTIVQLLFNPEEFSSPNIESFMIEYQGLIAFGR